jgi:hypothetical protein
MYEALASTPATQKRKGNKTGIERGLRTVSTKTKFASL